MNLLRAARAFGARYPVIVLGFSIVGLIVAIDIALIAAADDFAFDAHAYYNPAYGGTTNQQDAFTYTPPVLLLLRAISSMVGWHEFLLVYSVLIAIGVWMLAGPFTAIAVLTPWVATEITLGNIHVFLALVAVAGLRWPWLWAFALLTKVTPGVGILWFAFRREWRKLAIAFGATAVIALPTLILAPGLWADWIRFAAASGDQSATGFGVPLVVRLPAAVVLVFIGARKDWKWLVPVASMVALPVLWSVHGLSMLLGVVWYLRGGGSVLPRLRRPAAAAPSTPAPAAA